MFDNFLVEARTTEHDSYSVSKKEFQKITGEAIATPPNCLPAMQVTIQGMRLWIMREDDMTALQEELILLRNASA